MSEIEHEQEPHESTLPPKPEPEDMPGEEGDSPPTDEEEAEAQAEVEPLAPDVARDDDTVDDEESEMYPDEDE
jgi:hypothetical protein